MTENILVDALSFSLIINSRVIDKQIDYDNKLQKNVNEGRKNGKEEEEESGGVITSK